MFIYTYIMSICRLIKKLLQQLFTDNIFLQAVNYVTKPVSFLLAFLNICVCNCYVYACTYICTLNGLWYCTYIHIYIYGLMYFYVVILYDVIMSLDSNNLYKENHLINHHCDIEFTYIYMYIGTHKRYPIWTVTK